MDQETLGNHLSRLSKHLFNNVCKIIVQDVFHEIAIDVDGKSDGGTDITTFTNDGQRKPIGYQMTTQKTDIKRKAYIDAKKTIDKLKAKRFYYFTTFFLNEIDARKIEHMIETDLEIPCTCLSSNQMAGLILSENLLNKFLDESAYPMPKGSNVENFDYRENALHSYTLLSSDSLKLKENIYDDSIQFILGNKGPLGEAEIINEVSRLLLLEERKEEILKKRLGAMFLKKLHKTTDGKITLSLNSKNEFEARQRIYEQELCTLSSAQIDLFRNEYNVEWSLEDSKKMSIWIADATVAEQIKTLKEAKASIITNPIFEIADRGLEKIKNYLTQEKKMSKMSVDDCIKKVFDLASNHPLITKISRASVYIALEGANPVSSAKALGASRWSDIKILIEPTVAIPYCCSILYKDGINKFFDMSVRAIKRAKQLDATLAIPYFYINECAGHLLEARKYLEFDLNELELQYSSNAFIANYYSLKVQGEPLPTSLLEYLATFSTAIKTEREKKDWVRTIMSDIQSILNKNGIEFISTPTYDHQTCAEFEKEYSHYLTEYELNKPSHLIDHDIWALQFTNDDIKKNNSHWIILTYDRSLTAVSKNDSYLGWITSPLRFLELTETAKPLSESHVVSLVHSVATYSERTLSAGARIIDRIIRYASPDTQNWLFKQEIDNFRKEVIESINLAEPNYFDLIDQRTDEFLKKLGIKMEKDDNINVDIPSISS